MTSRLDLIDRKLLNILQSAFPLVENPFESIAQELAMSEEEREEGESLEEFGKKLVEIEKKIRTIRE